jgi:hypothetical protein
MGPVTSDPRAFFALDFGSATTSAALVALVEGRWRLLGTRVAPAQIGVDVLIASLAESVSSADPAFGRAIEASTPSRAAEWPRLVARHPPPARITVIAATETTREALAASASAAGWLVTSASLERDPVLEVMRAGLERGTSTILAGLGEPPSGGERQRAAALRAIVEAIAVRRPEATLVLAGSLAVATSLDEADPTTGPERIYAPAAVPSEGERYRSDLGSGLGGDPLGGLLLRLRAAADDAVAGTVRATASLAAVIGRRVETVAVGFGTALRVVARPPGLEMPDEPTDALVLSVLVPEAALVPDALDDRFVDDVLGWSTVPVDRIRLRDRLRELRLAPWADADGDGAALRLAVARAALARLAEATPEIGDLGAPDLVVATGEAFGAAPGPAIALALADTLRRPGASGLALDHARLLGPIGTLPDEDERRQLLADLVDDLLAPLGSVVSPQGLHAGRSAGRLTVHAGTGSSELELIPGGLQLVDLPPGQVATADFLFREPVRLGTRGRHFSVEVGGGLGGLLIDLRDVPLRLPDRLEQRRELLAAWQGALWTGSDE